MFCSACQREVQRFLPYGIPPREGRCPHCDAKPRVRALLWFFRCNLLPGLRRGVPVEILEVGASKANLRFLPALLDAAAPWVRYTVLDTRVLNHHAELQAPHEYVNADIESCDFRDESFDVILCNNTLPYVVDDHAALAQIARCLTVRGVAMLNTQVAPGPTLSAAQLRARHPERDDAYFAAYFAENGDQRRYGDDFFHRVRDAGLNPQVVELFQDWDPGRKRYYGLKAENPCCLAFKATSAATRYKL